MVRLRRLHRLDRGVSNSKRDALYLLLRVPLNQRFQRRDRRLDAPLGLIGIVISGEVRQAKVIHKLKL